LLFETVVYAEEIKGKSYFRNLLIETTNRFCSFK